MSLEVLVLFFGLSLIVLGIGMYVFTQWQITHERIDLPPYLVNRSSGKR